MSAGNRELIHKQGLLQFLCTSLYDVGCRRKIDGRYWQMCRLYKNHFRIYR